MIGDFETKLHEPLSDEAGVVTKLIVEIGYADELRRNCKTGEEALARETNVQDMLRDLAQFIATLDVDGWIQKGISVATPPSKEILASARDLTPSRGWRSFSRQLTRDVGHSEFASGDTGKVSSASQTKPGNQVNSELAAREESVRAL